jgi:hypothetical protein
VCCGKTTDYVPDLVSQVFSGEFAEPFLRMAENFPSPLNFVHGTEELAEVESDRANAFEGSKLQLNVIGFGQVLESIFVFLPSDFNLRYRPKSMGFSLQIAELVVYFKLFLKQL